MTQTILNVRRAHPDLKPSPSVWLYVCPYFAFPLLLSSLPCGDAATVSIFQLDPSGARLEESVEKALRSLGCASVHPLPFLFVPRLPYLLPCFLLDCFSSLFDVLFLRVASFSHGFQLC